MGLSEKGGVKEKKKGESDDLVSGARGILRREEKMLAGDSVVVVPLG